MSKLNKIKMFFSGSRKYFWYCAFTVILLDQATKFLFFDILVFESPLVVVSNFFNIVRRTNPAAAFSLGPENPGFYVLATLTGLSIIIWFLKSVRPDRYLPVLGLGAVAGGAVGNLIDRLYMGEVRDFLDVHWYWRYHWPAFNVADAAICVGVGIILYETLRSSDALQNYILHN